MDTEKQSIVEEGTGGFLAGNDLPRSVTIARGGITNSHQFANVMSALMSDLLEGKITPGVGNAACNAGSKLLKVVEMQARYGQVGKGQVKILNLTGPTEPPPIPA